MVVCQPSYVPCSAHLRRDAPVTYNACAGSNWFFYPNDTVRIVEVYETGDETFDAFYKFVSDTQIQIFSDDQEVVLDAQVTISGDRMILIDEYGIEVELKRIGPAN